MAKNQNLIDRLASQIDEIANDTAPDFRFIEHIDLHTHTIDDIPQLQMLFNLGYIDSIYDKYYNPKAHSGFICYTNGMLVNFGQFKYNNNALETRVLLPLSYNGGVHYNLHYHKILEYTDELAAQLPIDNTYDIVVSEKTESGFKVKSPQLYIPSSITYNYITIGITELEYNH